MVSGGFINGESWGGVGVDRGGVAGTDRLLAPKMRLASTNTGGRNAERAKVSEFCSPESERKKKVPDTQKGVHHV